MLLNEVIGFDHWLTQITHWIKPVLMLVLGVVLLLLTKSVKQLVEKKARRNGLSIFDLIQQGRLHYSKKRL